MAITLIALVIARLDARHDGQLDNVKLKRWAGNGIAVGRHPDFPEPFVFPTPSTAFDDIIGCIDSLLGRKANRLGKTEEVGPLLVSVQCVKTRRTLKMAWRPGITAHEKLGLGAILGIHGLATGNPV